MAVYAPGNQGYVSQNLPPPYLSSFGLAEVSAAGVLTMKLMSVTGAVLYTKTLQPDIAEPCTVSVNVYNAVTNQLVTAVPNGGSLITPPCSVNIEVALTCSPSFTYGPVFIELMSGSSVIASRNELAAPFFLFGNNGADVLAGTIRAGTYSVRASAGGRTFSSSVITLGTCV
jgi:hypothetical protein